MTKKDQPKKATMSVTAMTPVVIEVDGYLLDRIANSLEDLCTVVQRIEVKLSDIEQQLKENGRR